MSHYCHAGARGKGKYRAYSFFTLALNGGAGQRHAITTLQTYNFHILDSLPKIPPQTGDYIRDLTHVSS
jgi:hypothetical protein